ncbi:hypothetical protein OBRU01_26099 [Operophtera brumata]|uniref:Uncharacterized protein n=1 Tax=Operophtera brumata TaxID=104452 RepID=A0A0L7K4C9_OPEBR|nr:hypothetical protein OBRU01_26099 [Operophtera brumata]
MFLKRHLHYDTKRDEIIGLHNINGEVTEEIASHACAIMLRDEIITKLFNIGIKAVIADHGSNFDKYAKDIKKVTAENP